MTKIYELLRDEEAFDFLCSIADSDVGEAFVLRDVRVVWRAATIILQVIRNIYKLLFENEDLNCVLRGSR